MNTKENRHSDPVVLGKYLVNKGDNDSVPEIFCNVGTPYTDLTKKGVRDAVNYMGDLATTKAKSFAQHLQLSPDIEAGKRTTREDIQFMIDTALEQRGWKQGSKVRPHVATIHRKDGRMHIHLAVSSYNPDTGKMDPNKKWARDHLEIRKKIETTLGHKRTREQNPNLDIINMDMTAIWGTVSTGAQFIQAAQKKGYLIAKGGRKQPLQVVDWEGVGHDLVKMIDGANARQVNDLLRGETLPWYKDAIRENRAKYEASKRANRQAEKTEQFDYSPDSRSEKKPRIRIGVGNDPLEKKQEAAIAALNRFRQKQEQKNEDQKRFNEKMTAFRDNEVMVDQPEPKDKKKPSQYERASDETLSKKQDAAIAGIDKFKKQEEQKRFNKAMSEFKENEMTEEERVKLERERLLKETREQLEKALKKGKGLSL